MANAMETSKVVGVPAKAKMQNILSRKSVEKTKQIQPCCYVRLIKPKTSWVQPQIFLDHPKPSRRT